MRGRGRLREVMTGVATWPHVSGPPRLALSVGASAVIVGIAVADYTTGPELSWAVFYLVPVVAGTMLGGTATGLALSAESAFAWVVADALVRQPGAAIPVAVWNGALRCLILSVVVGLLASLRQAVGEAHASDARTREFLAYAAHQLRTPISGISTAAEALMIGGVSPTQEALLAHLATEARRTGQLSAALLRVARLEQGESPGRQPCDLVALCGDEVERHRDRALPKIEVVLTLGEVPEHLVEVDGEGIREALANLLDNACRHARRRVEVRLTASAETFGIVVADDGPGLPVGDEERAFDRFVSFDGHGGSGLGLTIARGIARSHGGDLQYVGGHFVMSVPFPAAPAARPPVRRPMPAAAPAAAPAAPPRKAR